ncbi:MAG: glycosyltransferase family 2 protein [bacterium]
MVDYDEVSTVKHVSIVIITSNRRDDLEVCLQSVMIQNYPSLETVVVDNNSSDGTATMIRELFPWVKYIGLEENIGIAARNRGFTESEGDLIITLDDDSELPADNVVSRIVEKFRGNPELGAASFRIINGRTGEDEEWFTPSARVLEKVDVHQGYFSPTINTCGAAIRPEMFERTGGFWEPYYIYVEERDLATRIIATGAEVRYFPTITIIHHRPAKKLSRRYHYYQGRNMLWYIWRNFAVITAFRKTVKHFFADGFFALKEGNFLPWLKGFFEGMLHLRLAFETRKPVQKKYLPFVDE